MFCVIGSPKCEKRKVDYLCSTCSPSPFSDSSTARQDFFRSVPSFDAGFSLAKCPRDHEIGAYVVQASTSQVLVCVRADVYYAGRGGSRARSREKREMKRGPGNRQWRERFLDEIAGWSIKSGNEPVIGRRGVAAFLPKTAPRWAETRKGAASIDGARFGATPFLCSGMLSPALLPR